MNKLLILRGLPSSGKSTWAKKWVEEAPKERVRVNRDDIRRMLGPYWVPQREDLVTDIETLSIESALDREYSVVVDATNLNPKRGLGNEQLVRSFFGYGFEVEYIDFDVDVEECIRRDKGRPKEEQVGEKVIRNFAKKYYEDKQ